MTNKISVDIFMGFVLAGVLLLVNCLAGHVLHALIPSCF